MNRLLLLVFFLPVISSQAQINPPSQKMALIVAVGQYPQNSGWPPIASINDIKYIKGALLNKGFKEKKIDTLKNNKATKEGILKALDNLVKKAGPNDVIVIHFSCHGQQIQDQETEAEGKDEVDGYDEALIPYDAKGRYNASPLEYGGYHGENHLRDDDLEKKFTAIRNKIKPNGNLLVIIDACHSGTASRSTEFIARGIPVPFKAPEYKVDPNLLAGLKNGAEKNFIGDGSDTLSNMVVISASSPQQQNFQLWDDKGLDVGSLSFAFAKAMNDIKPGDDYQLLFEKIKARIQAGIPTQIPMVEGNLQQQVLGAQFNAPEETIILSVSKVDKKVKEDSVFIIDKGALNNISKGSTCKIYQAGKKEPFTEGVIVNVGTFQSSGVAKKLLKKEEAYRAEIDEVSFGEFSTSLFISDSLVKDHSLKKQVEDLLKPNQFVTINKSKNAELILKLKEMNGRTHMELFDRGDSTRWTKDMDPSDTLSKLEKENLISSIKNSIRIKYLRSLPDGGELNKNIVIEMSSKNNSGNNEMILKPGDLYKIKLTNNSDELVYFTIVDIMPDNSMKVFIPDTGHKAEEYDLRKGITRSFTAQVDTASPSGKEVFKIFITKEAIDLRSVFERKNKMGKRAFTLSLEDMIDDTFKDSKNVTATRSDVSSVKLNEAGILTAGFTIKKQIP